MRPSRKAGFGLLGGVAAVALAVTAIGPAAGQQQQAPQSLLPPGFEQAPPAPPTQPAPPPQPGATPAPPRAGPLPLLPPGQGAPLAPPPPLSLESEDGQQTVEQQQAQQAQAEAKAAAVALRKQDVPEAARRGVDHIGFLPTGVTGVSADGFGATDGRFLATLMRRLDAPIASRWLSMLLRRVLVTDLTTPANIAPGDWVADRAALLVRMGEADAGRLLVQSLDSDRATPRYYQAVLAASLATADPTGLCGVADAAEGATKDPAWPLARAMCAGIQGEGGTAAGLIDRARSMRGGDRDVDLLLAERVVGAGTNARRSPDINWSQVDTLTPWRFGIGSALGLEIPANLLDGGGLAMQAWRARAPMLPLASRLGAERVAATLGTVSSDDLVDAYSAAAEESDDPQSTGDTPAGRLRRAFAARDMEDRITALRALWGDPANERDGYAAQILTARAATRIPATSDYSDDAVALIRAMLSAGYDIQAARWAGVAGGLRGTPGEEARALLAVGAPGAMRFDPGTIPDFGEGGRGSARLRAQFLFASLAGLGRLSSAQAGELSRTLGVPLGARDPWTRAIEAAVARQEPATVVLLAAVGMQTSDWAQVPPAFLYHIVAALHAVGFDPEARMIAAEALSRT